MVFGTRSLCARLDAPVQLWCGGCSLPTVAPVEYLGRCPEIQGGWGAQQAAGAAKGWAAAS